MSWTQPEGWYDDPAGSGLRRWWDGRVWGEIEQAAAAGWYIEPSTQQRRYWDGENWGDYDLRPAATQRGPAHQRRVRQGGGVLNQRQLPSWVKTVVIAVLIVIVVLGAWKWLDRPHYTTLPTVPWSNATSAHVTGSLKGIVALSHEADGSIQLTCVDGTKLTVASGASTASPCVSHLKG